MKLTDRFTVVIPRGLEVTTQNEWDTLDLKRFEARVWLRLYTGHLNPIPRRKAQFIPNFLRLQAD